jgi:DNA-directed RNA polymerase I and III subunit RPAC1
MLVLLQVLIDCTVYAHQITFHPSGRQPEFFDGDDAIQAVNPDILIAKLRPGQCIDLTMHCHKGIGADHAKFSPVATATYRLMPSIEILKPIVGDHANHFRRCFPRNVIIEEEITKKESEEKGGMYEGIAPGITKAVVNDPMRDTVSRECLRHEVFQGKVKLGRIQDHFIFRVESTGQFESEELFIESVRLLKAKCERVKRCLGELNGLKE